MNRISGSFVIVAASVLSIAFTPCPAAGASDGRERLAAESAAHEYDVTWQEASVLRDLGPSWHAPNRAHNLRTYFTSAGIRVVPREEATTSWEWGLTLVRYGRSAPATEAVVLSAHDNQLTYDHGEIVERYENGPRGLEQRLVLSSRAVPADDGNDAREIHLDLSWTGTLAPLSGSHGSWVDFQTRERTVVRYALLRVEDAGARVLPARIEASSESKAMSIAFDDDGSTYPVTVHLVATSPAWIAEGGQAFASFGNSVATAGDVNGDGYSDVIVGAPFYDNGEANEGRAFVYLGSATGLAATPTWSAEGNQQNAEYGFSVGTAGDVNGDGFSDVIVGAPLYLNGTLPAGQAYLYLGSASGLATTAAWIGPAADRGFCCQDYGSSVGTAGDVNGDGYDDVIVGKPGGAFSQSWAFVYLGSASGLGTSNVWEHLETRSGKFYGCSVGTAGDVNGDGYDDIIVGERGSDNGETGEGQAFLYLGSASGVSTLKSWTGESDQVGAEYGSSVGTAGDVNGDGYSDVIVGARVFDRGQLDEGLAQVYLGSASGLSAASSWIGESDQESSFFGTSVATAGDVNADGYSDVVVGAPGYDNGEVDEGSVFVYLGSPSGLGATPGWTAESDQEGAQLGISCGPAGDVNGDISSDVIAGAFLYDNGQTSEGSASVYLGTGGHPPTLGGAVTGLATKKVSCRNMSTGGSVTDRTNDTTWDCEGLGLPVSSGDQVDTTASGVATSAGPFGGSVTRMIPSKVFCQNLTTRTSVNARTSARSWDCQAMGLVVAAGDRVMTGAQGTVE